MKPFGITLHYKHLVFQSPCRSQRARGPINQEGSFADSGLLVRVQGSPNCGLCAQSRDPGLSKLPLGLPRISPLGRHGPGLSLWTLLNTGRPARKYLQGTDGHGEHDLFVGKKPSCANFNYFKWKDEIM